MKATALLAFVLASAAPAADPAPPETLLAQPDKLLVSDDFNSTIDKGRWHLPTGKWEIVEGALRGGAEKSAATISHAMKMQDFIATFELKLDGATLVSFTINAFKDHMARVQLAPTRFVVRRDDNDHAGPDQAVTFLATPVKLEPGRWHTVVMEMVGDTLVGTLDGETTGHGSDALFKAAKFRPCFRVSGETASIRNVRIWSAKAEPKANWSETKAKLEAKRQNR